MGIQIQGQQTGGASQAQVDAIAAELDLVEVAVLALEAEVAALSGATLPLGYIDGLTISNNVADATNDIDVAVGVARSGADTFDLELAASITKRLDANFVAGTGQGGLDTGNKANSTWYHVWLIRTDADGVCDILLSTSVSAPTMPAGYTAKRRIGAVLTDGTGIIRPFVQTGDYFRWKTTQSSTGALGGTITTSRQLIVVATPLGVKCKARLAIDAITAGTESILMTVTDPDVANVAPSNVNFNALASDGSGFRGGSEVTCFTNTSSQVAVRSVINMRTYDLHCHGYDDLRGKL